MSSLIYIFFIASVFLTNPVATEVIDPQHGPDTSLLLQTKPVYKSSCRCFFGDSCWPKPSQWRAFNQSLGGKLIATTPIGSPCHDDAFGPFDAERCANLRSNWFFPETHLVTPSSVMAPYFTNNTCNPFLPRDAGCTLGNYISYAVNASDATHFLKTIAFVQKHNIRMTIRNTGHDYNGKSTGAGAVAIWTHHMKEMNIIDYKSANYTGKAIKLGAGVQAIDAYRYAYDRGFVVVGGNCPTVGIAGGYTQGGGHSPLSSKFGMAADQALEWEVATATGKHLIASQSQNTDLYWALSGGGGGTYGVVASLTVKAHPDITTSVANLTFTSTAVEQDSFWKVVRTFHESLPSLVDNGAVAIFVLTKESFSLMPVQGPGLPKAQLQRLLDPTLDMLKQEKIKYSRFGGLLSLCLINTDTPSKHSTLASFRHITIATELTILHGTFPMLRLVGESFQGRLLKGTHLLWCKQNVKSSVVI